MLGIKKGTGSVKDRNPASGTGSETMTGIIK